MLFSIHDPMEETEDTGAGWQLVAWASGVTVTFVILAAMSNFT